MEYSQFGLSVINAISAFLPNLAVVLLFSLSPVVILLLGKVAIAGYEKAVQLLNERKQRRQKVKEPITTIKVAEKIELGNIAADGGYYKTKFAFEMFGKTKDITVLKRDSSSKTGYRQYGFDAISQKQLEEICQDDARLDAALSGNLIVVSESNKKASGATTRYMRVSGPYSYEV
jgi:hypothetical protein